ncbi:MAG: tRNA pseudouridine(55) synthase TruB [Chloroflexi bacterium]|nr:tRNA pseudouridine(55) synthase TruB [Chloroflexota bacterium]
MPVDGILNVDKPGNMTSFGVVSLVKKLTRQRRAGHGGTLDPLATGVLLVLLGHATRVAQYLLEARKTYRAVIELGTATDSYDGEGAVVYKRDPAAVTRESVEEGLAQFRGRIWQSPPPFSAVRSGGRRLYDLARRGEVVVPAPRQRTVYRLELVEWTPPAMTVEVECEGGFYVRSLANDLGERLGCGAYLKELRRLTCGDFRLEDAISLDELKALDAPALAARLKPVDSVLQDRAAVTLNAENTRDFCHGRVVEIPLNPPFSKGEDLLPPPLPLLQKGEDRLPAAVPLSEKGDTGGFAPAGGELRRVYSEDGTFLGVGWWEVIGGFLYPKKVFFHPPAAEK